MRSAFQIILILATLVSSISHAQENEDLGVIESLANVFSTKSEGTINQSSTLPFQSSTFSSVSVVSQIAVFSYMLSPENVSEDPEFNPMRIRQEIRELYDDRRASLEDKMLIQALLKRLDAIEANSAKAKITSPSAR